MTGQWHPPEPDNPGTLYRFPVSLVAASPPLAEIYIVFPGYPEVFAMDRIVFQNRQAAWQKGYRN